MQFLTILASALALVSAAPSVKQASATPLKIAKFCSNNGDILTPTSVDITDPIKKGGDVVFKLVGSNSEPVGEGTTMDVSVKMGGIKVLEETMDFCKEIQQAGLSCPMPAGPITIEKTIPLPAEILVGNYNVHVVMKTGAGKQVTCADATFKIVS